MSKAVNPNFEMAVKIVKMLEIIPVYPKYVTARDVHNKLAEEGIEFTERGVLRYLHKMAGYFPIDCCDKGKPYKWRKIA